MKDRKKTCASVAGGVFNTGDQPVGMAIIQPEFDRI